MSWAVGATLVAGILGALILRTGLDERMLEVVAPAEGLYRMGGADDECVTEWGDELRHELPELIFFLLSWSS
jgi:hypothetical protein